MRRWVTSAVAALLLSAAAACGGGGGDDEGASDATTGSPAAATVTMKNVKFDPETVTVKAGDTVRWVWDDGSVQHDVSGEGFKSETQAKGTFDHKFEAAGTFAYICMVHPDTMKGTVEVS